MSEENKTRTMSGLALRWVTGVVLAGAVLGLALWAPPEVLVAVFALVAGVGAWEYDRLALPAADGGRRWLLVLFSADVVLAALLGPGTVAAALGVGLLLLLAAELSGPGEPAELWQRLALRGFGLLYLGGLFACLMLVRLRGGPLHFLMVVACVVAADAGAYYAGHLWGQRRMAPRLSPGKSLEGLAGGLALALVVGAVFGSFLLDSEATWAGIVRGALLGLALGGASVLGDLLESLIKRAAGAKDSGNLLPGHGGMLDRVDGLMLAGPVMLLFLESPWLR